MQSTNKKIKVVHIATTTKGGAGIATVNLAIALQNLQIANEIITLQNEHHHSLAISPINTQSVIEKKITSLNSSNIYPVNTYFSHIHTPTSFARIDEVVSNCDIINIHWVSGLLSVENIAYLSHQPRPVVWTWHDKYPVTGGCHYFHGCEKWRADCHDCPQLKNTFENMPARMLTTKKKYINYDNITVVALNRHFQQLATQSPLFNTSRIEIIPNSINTDIYKPRPITYYKKLKRTLQGKKILLFISSSHSSIKGLTQFCEMTQYLTHHHDYHLIIAGHAILSHNTIALPYTHVGFVSQQEQLIDLYNMSDVTVVPSIEDNLPNVCLESLSCGTPVVGFQTGGIPDIITNGYNGYTVAPIGDSRALAHAVETTLQGPDLSSHCRKYAEEHLTPVTQGTRYARLYAELLEHNSTQHTPRNNTPRIKEELFPELLPSYDALYAHVIKPIINEYETMDRKLRHITQSNYYKFHTGNIKRKIVILIKILCVLFRIYPLSVKVYIRLKRIVTRQHKIHTRK